MQPTYTAEQAKNLTEQGWKSSDFAGSKILPSTSPSVSGANAFSSSSSPTVITDSNTRESTIPDVQNKTKNLLATNTGSVNQNKEQNNQSTPEIPSYESVYSKALGDVGKQIDSDPTNMLVLQSLKDMQTKSDASTAAQLDAVHAGYQAREQMQKESNGSTTAHLKGLLMSGGAYRTGSGDSLISAKEKFDIQGLSVLANEETAAKAALYKAKQDNDFQIMDRINTQLEKIQDKK